ncbi:MAG TPA: hypothetical protein PLP14_07295, partial [Chitinophagaceae bacterium]|nr:hypothetical protein [Chitinophagaceae bacterium]
MKKVLHILLAVVLLLAHLPAGAHGRSSGNPVEYIENKGQWQAPFLFKGVTPRGDIYLKEDGFRILLSDDQNHDKVHGVRHGWIPAPQTLNFHAFDIHFVQSNPHPEMEGEKPQKHYYNYFLGKDPAHWKSEIHPVMAVNYKQVWDGIDAHIYSEESNIKYDFIVHPGADYRQIQLSYQGVDKVELRNQNLVLSTSLGELTEWKP